MNLTFEKADAIKLSELELVQNLVEIDQHRLYVFCGYKSLMGFCNHGLKFTRPQSQRLTTLARRHGPNVEKFSANKSESSSLCTNG